MTFPTNDGEAAMPPADPPPARRRLVVSFDDDPGGAAPAPQLQREADLDVALRSPTAPPPPPPAPPADRGAGLPPLPAPPPPLRVEPRFDVPDPADVAVPAAAGALRAALGTGPLASRGARFLARMLDGLILTPANIVVFVIAGAVAGGVFAGGVSSCELDDGVYACDSAASAGIGGLFALFFVLLVGGAGVVALLAALTVRAGERNGQTIGRQVLGTRLVKVDGTPIDWPTALRREVLFPFLLSIPFGLGSLVDAAWAFTDARKRRLVDVWCGTEVVVAQGTAPGVAGAAQPQATEPLPYIADRN